MKKLKNSELNRISVKNFRRSKKTPIIIILDNVRSAFNVGSVFRSSDAFRIEKIYLCGITASPPSKEIRKSALGSYESVEWEYVDDTKKAILDVKSQAYKVFAVEQTDGSILLNQYNSYSSSIAIVFGNEINGVAQNIIDSFSEGSFDKVILVYNQFKNAATQIVKTEGFLPLEKEIYDQV